MLLRELVQCPSLEVFKTQPTKALSNLAWVQCWSCFEQEGGLEAACSLQDLTFFSLQNYPFLHLPDPSQNSATMCLSNSIKWDAFEKLNPFFNHKEKQNQYRNERESSLHSSSTWGMSSSHILFWGWMLHLLFQPCLWGYSSTATLARGFYSLVRLPGKEKVSLL